MKHRVRAIYSVLAATALALLFNAVPGTAQSKHTETATPAASLTHYRPDPLTLLLETQGDWEGELYYLDYQSGQRFAIPMRVTATATADGATLTRAITYTDPGNLVYAQQLLTVSEDQTVLKESYFRERNGEFFSSQLTDVTQSDVNHWLKAFHEQGEDDGRPAEIRHEWQREGDALLTRKLVRFADQPDADFIERNGSRLVLQRSSP